MKQFTISPNESGQRFDKYLKKLLSNASGSFVYKMLRKKNITLNDRKADGTEKLNAGDLVKLFLSDETFEKFSGKDETNSGYMKLKSIDSGRLQVVYEDDDVIIINKPSGMLSQKAVPEDISANEYILSYLIRKGALSEEQFKTFKPSICNRLDRNTSGLLIAGKTLKGLQTMAEAPTDPAPLGPEALTVEEQLILEHEGQAALFEMGEAVPDPADAVTHAEVEEPAAPEVPKAEKEQQIGRAHV